MNPRVRGLISELQRRIVPESRVTRKLSFVRRISTDKRACRH
jgi:hypothetical protein